MSTSQNSTVIHDDEGAQTTFACNCCTRKMDVIQPDTNQPENRYCPSCLQKFTEIYLFDLFAALPENTQKLYITWRNWTHEPYSLRSCRREAEAKFKFISALSDNHRDLFRTYEEYMSAVERRARHSVT